MKRIKAEYHRYIHLFFYYLAEYSEKKWHYHSDIAHKLLDELGKIEHIHCRIVIK